MTGRISYSLPGAVVTTGLSRATLMRAIGSGKLKAKKSKEDADGNPVGSFVIKAAELEAFIDGLPDA